MVRPRIYVKVSPNGLCGWVGVDCREKGIKGEPTSGEEDQGDGDRVGGSGN